VCCLVFAFAMILAGRVQDKTGPKMTAVMGGILTGAGLILIAFSTSWIIWIMGFGVLMGAGLGFGYASATPPAIKWFPPAKTGMIAGIVVAGFGLASVYIAPLSTWMITRFGLSQSMLIFGVAFLVIVCIPSPVSDQSRPKDMSIRMPGLHHNPLCRPGDGIDFSPGEMMKTGTFFKLWLMFCVGSGAGLMIIGSVAGMAKSGMGEIWPGSWWRSWRWEMPRAGWRQAYCPTGSAGPIPFSSCCVSRQWSFFPLLFIGPGQVLLLVTGRHPDRVQLRHQPVIVPIRHQGFFRVEKLRGQLRAGVFRLGDRRIHLSPGVPDDRGLYRQPFKMAYILAAALLLTRRGAGAGDPGAGTCRRHPAPGCPGSGFRKKLIHTQNPAAGRFMNDATL
jgi:MFS transporter, OFA family, oxalate/formate antiporter